MPRRARLILPGIPLHIVQRGHNRQPCFHSRSDDMVYLDKLTEHAVSTECSVHAYVLMTNHVHILLSFEDMRGPSRLVRLLGQQYTLYLNKRLGRSGTTWEGRYWSCPVPTEPYLLTCQRYIEQNPVRAGMVNQQEHYQWSSYQGNIGLRTDGLLSPHELYQRLGLNEQERQRNYRLLFSRQLTEPELTEIREGLKEATLCGRPARLPGRPKKIVL